MEVTSIVMIQLRPADRGDGPAIISGGVQVPKSTFTKWVGHPGIVKADLSSLGLNYGSVTAGGGCGGDCTGFAKAGLVFANLSMVLAGIDSAPDAQHPTYRRSPPSQKAAIKRCVFPEFWMRQPRFTDALF